MGIYLHKSKSITGNRNGTSMGIEYESSTGKRSKSILAASFILLFCALASKGLFLINVLVTKTLSCDCETVPLTQLKDGCPSFSAACATV